MRQEVLVGDGGPCPGLERWEMRLGRGGVDCCLGGWRGLRVMKGRGERKMNEKEIKKKISKYRRTAGLRVSSGRYVCANGLVAMWTVR